jgi:hypothetical protein
MFYRPFITGIVEKYAIDDQTSLASAVEIKNLGLRLFAGSNYAKVRVAGLEILHRLFSPETTLGKIPEAAEVLDVEGILVKHLYSFIGKASKRQGLLARVIKCRSWKVTTVFKNLNLHYRASIKLLGASLRRFR